MTKPNITIQLRNKSGEAASVYVDEDGMICGLPPGAESALIGTKFLADAKKYRAQVARAEKAARLAALRPILGYRVCTFGLPSGARGQGYGPHEGGLYLVRGGAISAANSSVGSGSCTNARVAVIYEAEADPCISEGGGKGWEWLSSRQQEEI